MAKNKQTKTEEPMERFMHRMDCPDKSPYWDLCYLHSGYTSPTCHITAACNGNCERMKQWDREHGIADGAEFDLIRCD